MRNLDDISGLSAAGGGALAAFGASACCGLPILLVSAGVGAAWLGSISLIVGPYRVPLLMVAAVLLSFAAWRLFRSHRGQRAGAGATSIGRSLQAAAILIGFALLAVETFIA